MKNFPVKILKKSQTKIFHLRKINKKQHRWLCASIKINYHANKRLFREFIWFSGFLSFSNQKKINLLNGYFLKLISPKGLGREKSNSLYDFCYLFSALLWFGGIHDRQHHFSLQFLLGQRKNVKLETYLKLLWHQWAVHTKLHVKSINYVYKIQSCYFRWNWKCTMWMGWEKFRSSKLRQRNHALTVAMSPISL